MSDNSTLAAQHGTRKASVANVYLQPGNGEILVRCSGTKKKVSKAKRKGIERSEIKTLFTVDEYFATIAAQEPTAFLKEILVKVNKASCFKVIIRVKGGGLKSQLTAARLALAKAVVEYDPELKPQISTECRTDARKKERAKVGCRGKARRKVQFSKR